MSALPTLAEIPPLPAGHSRQTDDLILTALIPREDAEFRAAVMRVFMEEEIESITPGGGLNPGGIHRFTGLSDIPARTPGGLAWKLAQALDYWRDEEEWPWWRYLLQSALVDAIELERHRAEAPGRAASGGEA